MTLRAYFYSKRSRNLALLGGMAVVLGLWAFLALHHRAAQMAPKYDEATFLPGLAHALSAGEVTRIHIKSQKADFVVAFVPVKGWVLPGSGNYPASFEVVKETLVALAALETIEPKTDDPALYSFVGLDTPPKGDGVSIVLRNDKGKLLASLILGKSEMRGEDYTLFVRRAGEKQSWLVKSPAPIKTAPADWMDKAVVSLSRERVASVAVEPASGPAYSLTRDNAQAENFAVTPLPKGRELTYAGAGDSAATVLADFAFDDIKPAASFDFSSAAHMTLKSFDGLLVSLDIVTSGNDHWVRVSANGMPGAMGAIKEAYAINARTTGWAFKIPSFKASLYATPLETLLKPKK
ncbi:hypothetical protein FHS83_003767 [Rhizomicrobium palustre]|uniref:DUF4340 domain-containing protein n=1 Tax=Rhizomicrobium palustre TaxID=189966 RepID=A0A846N4K0_9PROT|nr:DUF4340 domain-containing protein [Rhizomicrobium palustre]NIK90449.1 hypothetical protein [Rhizomicrobium palustre]